MLDSHCLRVTPLTPSLLYESSKHCYNPFTLFSLATYELILSLSPFSYFFVVYHFTYYWNSIYVTLCFSGPSILLLVSLCTIADCHTIHSPVEELWPSSGIQLTLFRKYASKRAGLQMWCLAQLVTILYNLKNVKNTYGRVSQLY